MIWKYRGLEIIVAILNWRDLIYYQTDDLLYVNLKLVHVVNTLENWPKFILYLRHFLHAYASRIVQYAFVTHSLSAK